MSFSSLLICAPLSLSPFSFPFQQRAHWHAAHKAVCCLQAGGVGAAALALFQPPPSRRQISAAFAASDAHGRAGRHAEALATLKTVLASMEGAFGMDAVELLVPLTGIAQSYRFLGELSDSYTVVLRALTICEKHHGEEGMMTCELRSHMGELPVRETFVPPLRSFYRQPLP